MDHAVAIMQDASFLQFNACLFVNQKYCTPYGQAVIFYLCKSEFKALMSISPWFRISLQKRPSLDLLGAALLIDSHRISRDSGSFPTNEAEVEAKVHAVGRQGIQSYVFHRLCQPTVQLTSAHASADRLALGIPTWAFTD